jgi:hypothetical protein
VIEHTLPGDGTESAMRTEMDLRMLAFTRYRSIIELHA